MKTKLTYLLIIVILITLQCKSENYNTNNSTQYNMNQLPASYCPFDIAIDPMERLLLINIENDPDSVCIGFEPQIFNDSINGKGIIVIGWRADGYIDVYHQPQMHLKGSKYNIAGMAGMTPSGGWNPRPNKPSLRLLFSVVGVFKKWPTTYHLSAEIQTNESDPPIMQSAWVRK